MSGSRLARKPWALVGFLAVAAGCQSYNFNPVGHCTLHPGSETFTLSNISTADVLFVVDDSGSMAGEQAKLAAAFGAFISNLDATNAARAAGGLQPIDFHIAVTTTSVFWNYQTATTCSSTCGSAGGQLVCCNDSNNTPALRAKACTPGVTTCPGTTTCSTSCTGLKGESYCCAADGSFPAGSKTEIIPCSRVGTTCGTFEHHFNYNNNPACSSGVSVDQWTFPRGDFVSWTSGSSANPRVLHFDKSLYPNPPSPSATNRQGFTRADLMAAFSGGTFKGATVRGNVVAGTCGSGEEQGLQAARLALEKAMAGQQKDTYDVSGVLGWNATTRAASASAEWPHANSKLVLVFVGDEDDCSSPQDPSGGVVMLDQGAGHDACVHDSDTTNYPPPLGGKELDVATHFASYFTSLGHPVGAAFIVSTQQSACGYGTFGACSPGLCCQPDCPNAGTCGQDFGPNYCGGQAPGSRFFAASTALKSAGADVVVGSICDPNFDTLLDKIADILKLPTGLELPSVPAAQDVTVLRIASESGSTVKVCSRPLAAQQGMTLDQAQSAKDADGNPYDWWFTENGNPNPPAIDGSGHTVLTRYVYINPKGRCIANPGETYSSEYIGQLPDGGCGDHAAFGSLPAETGDEMCKRLLGGSSGSWTCYAPGSGQTCGPASYDVNTATGTGTCLCGSRSEKCFP